MITILAWAVAAVSFLAFLVVLSLGASCSNTVGQWSAGAFFFSWAWLTYWHDRRGPAMTEDTQTHRDRFRQWWAKWKDICIAAVLIPTALGCLVLGLQMRGYSRARADDAQIVRQLAQQRAEDAAATTKAARQACERSRALGPSLYEDYRIRQVLTGEKLALYRSLIPKTCPK